MKTLFLLRHAKSSWRDSQITDFDRPLNERGERVAPQMGEFMRANNLIPDKIVASPALRTRQTVALVTAAAGLTVEIEFNRKIYEAGVDDLFQVVAETAAHAEKLLLVGHNPGMENLVQALTGELRAMPTAALAIVHLSLGQWGEIEFGSGRLESLYQPTELFAN